MVENVYDLWQPSTFTTHLSQDRFKSFLPLGQFMDVQSQTWKWSKTRANPTQAISTRVASFGVKRWSVTAPFEKFHVVVVQWRRRNVQKRVLFCLLDLLLFCCPRRRRRRRRRLGCFNSVKALMSPRNTTTEDQAHPVAKFAANSGLDLP